MSDLSVEQKKLLENKRKELGRALLVTAAFHGERIESYDEFFKIIFGKNFHQDTTAHNQYLIALAADCERRNEPDLTELIERKDGKKAKGQSENHDEIIEQVHRYWNIKGY